MIRRLIAWMKGASSQPELEQRPAERMLGKCPHLVLERIEPHSMAWHIPHIERPGMRCAACKQEFKP